MPLQSSANNDDNYDDDDDDVHIIKYYKLARSQSQ